jgi:colicin import membrane protein
MRPSLKPLGEMIAVAALAALAALAAPVQAQDIGQAPLGAPRVPQSHSVEQANATLEQVARDRAAVNDEFAASERVCNTKFFVNNCLDKAKEKRRAALASLRAIEVEAQHFKRADSVAKRDADLAERVRKDNEEQALRAAKPPKAPKEEHEAPHAPTGPTVAEREAEHDAKEKRQGAQEAAGAGKRAANVAAFEEKQAESLRRQAIVAKKKEENAAKQAAKQASDKKKADAAAAAAASRQK